MNAFSFTIGVLLSLSLSFVFGSDATFAQIPGEHAEVISPNSTNFLNPDHVRLVAPAPDTDNAPSHTTTTNAAPVFVPPNPLPAHPQWTWDVQNREFDNVVVTKVEADIVTITSDSGPAQIDISLLPPAIQKQLHYDPVLAAQAIAAKKAAAAPPPPSDSN